MRSRTYIEREERKFSASKLLVLCYHAISPDWSAGLSVTPEAFERQVSNLVRKGWASATFTDVVRQAPADKTVVITFDDAFASVKTYAEPVLSELGVKGTVFAPTDYVSRRAPLAWAGLDHWEEGPDAEELTPMTWDDLRELAELGWEIGSHSRTHPSLTSLGDNELADGAGRLPRGMLRADRAAGHVDRLPLWRRRRSRHGPHATGRLRVRCGAGVALLGALTATAFPESACINRTPGRGSASRSAACRGPRMGRD